MMTATTRDLVARLAELLSNERGSLAPALDPGHEANRLALPMPAPVGMEPAAPRSIPAPPPVRVTIEPLTGDKNRWPAPLPGRIARLP